MEQMDKLALDMDNRPLICEKCGGIMLFGGLGTYHCEKCGHVMMDDYGKVRAFLEINPGASITSASASTGVSQPRIRKMLKEARFQISQGSSSYLKCEMCGISISSGRFCMPCEAKHHKMLEEEQRKKRKNEKMQGTLHNSNLLEKGARRFERT